MFVFHLLTTNSSVVRDAMLVKQELRSFTRVKTSQYVLVALCAAGMHCMHTITWQLMIGAQDKVNCSKHTTLF